MTRQGRNRITPGRGAIGNNLVRIRRTGEIAGLAPGFPE